MLLSHVHAAGSAAKIARATEGLELAGLRYTRRGIKADAVLTRSKRAKLAASEVSVRLKRNRVMGRAIGYLLR